MAKSEVKWGALLSYVLIALNSIYGLIIMPFVLGAIGESEYGVYKTKKLIWKMGLKRSLNVKKKH